MVTIEKLKRILAIVILACFFLPLTQCTTVVPATGNETAIKKTTHILIPAKEISFKDINEVPFVAVFAWPLLAVFARRRFSTRRLSEVINAIEAVLCVLSVLYLIQIIKVWGNVMYGGITVISSLTCYFVATSAILLHHVRPHRA